MSLTRLVLATANPDKVVEISALLPGVDLVSRPSDIPEVVEDGDTLEANALLKARAICAATGSPAVADDTGLEVMALGGAPGVWSARFAGENATYGDNVAKLIADLEGESDRTARFRTVAAIVTPDGEEIVVDGVTWGTIAIEPVGSGGFGYDPVFIPDDGDGRVYAQMTLDEKNALSQRGRAFRALAKTLAL
ncbi:MAG: RdgB/HAM1 family non-canonical purine NTP pyrophosphatase [Actinomycetota bacterium]|nr:RdgB/HAM1 family non-canonical purine NTP pyrophosphatase [Actinomycetota bacterium]